jgi:hypothetical protein
VEIKANMHATTGNILTGTQPRCAKLFVDEGSTWHKSNRGIEQNIDGFYRKMTQKGGFNFV